MAHKKASKSDGIIMLAEMARGLEKKRAEKNLMKAKELEQININKGYKWVQEGKTRRLVRTVRK